MSNISELTAKRSKRDDVARKTSKAQDHALSSVANITSSRRQMIAGAALGLGSLAISAMPANSSTNMDGRTNMDSRLHQEVGFEVSASRIYAALLDEKQFTAFSGAPARIEPEAGGAFKLFYDHPPLKGASGRTLELVVNRLIVQAWRAEEWAPGDYSVVRFELKANGPGTLLVFDQVGLSTIPPARAWSVMYWDPLRKYLAS